MPAKTSNLLLMILLFSVILLPKQLSDWIGSLVYPTLLGISLAILSICAWKFLGEYEEEYIEWKSQMLRSFHVEDDIDE